MQNIEFPWSDNWWIEGNRAWFCGGEINALFCMNMNSGQCELLARIPECDFRNYRLYSYCMKYGDNVFCLPRIANVIWCYDLKKKIWEKIEIGSKNQLVMSTTAYKKMDNRIWLLEDGTGRILEVNLEQKVKEKEYNLFTYGTEVCDGCLLVGNKLYYIADDKVYCINIDNADISVYDIDGVRARLATICYDGNNFWMSSFCKEIYIWNPKQGVVKVITEFPKQFGVYNFNRYTLGLVDCDSFYSTEYPFFIMSIFLGKYIWYIPFQSNEILYIDKETHKMNILDIEGEQETEESLQRSFCSKYIVQYIREDRYIGLYSLKRQLIFEIDTVDLCVKNRNYKLSDKAFLAIAQGDGFYDGRRMFRESREKDQLFFSALLSANDKGTNNLSQSVGKLIYHALDE
ncbi:MAG: hypothetical protein HDR28_01175 [Lachnospiraceae bacterium]|nr:hypothetical protein [Lachnospiraceae bacterium]